MVNTHLDTTVPLYIWSKLNKQDREKPSLESFRSNIRKTDLESLVENKCRDCLKAQNYEYRACAKRSNFEKTWEEFPVNSMLITGTITAKEKVREKVPGLYAVCR